MACITIVQAQVPISTAPNELQRQEQRQQLLREQREDSSARLFEQGIPQAPQRLPEESPCFVVRQIQIGGHMGLVSDASLSGVAGDDPPQGRCLGSAGIQMLADRLRNALVGKGYLTAQIAIPDQDLNTGELQITVIPGTVHTITVAPAARSTPRNTLAISEGSILRLQDIEQTLENLRRLSTASADITITPAETPAQSDIHINYVVDKPLQGTVSFDNAGNDSTGRWHGGLSLAWNAPTGMGDLLQWDLNQNLADWQQHSQGFRSNTFHYNIPIGYWSLGFTINRHRYRQTIAGAFQSYLYSGRSGSTELEIGKVIHRSGYSRTSASITAFSRHSSNFIDDTEIEVQRRRTGGWMLSARHMEQFRHTVVNTRLDFRRGTGAFRAMAAPEERFGEGSSRMKVLALNIDVQTPVGGTAFPLNYRTQLRGQWNHTPLTPQDRFCLGGRGTVRGFGEDKSVCTERGLLWRNELSHSIQQATMLWQLYTTLDAGRAGGQWPTGHPLLVGATMGIRTTLVHATGASTHLDIHVGKPLRQPSFFERGNTTTAAVQLSSTF